MKKSHLRSNWGIGIALAVAAAAIVFIAYRWRTSGFAWDQFVKALSSVAPSWLALAVVLIMASYVGRALRWEVMLRPLNSHANLWRIFTATTIGFTAVVLFGRAGEPVRPYLISKQQNVSFSSQIAAWFVERILDLLMVLLAFGIALTDVSSGAIRHGARTRLVLQTGGYTAALTGAACLGLLIAMRQFHGNLQQRVLGALSFLPERLLGRIESVVASFEEGIECTRRASSTFMLIGYTVIEWLIIVGAFFSVFRAFPATARLDFSDIVIVFGFVAFGSAIQIPGVGGGMQIATVVILTQFFGIGIEVASGIALILWIISFVVIVPFGLALAFHEGIKWRSLKQASRERKDSRQDDKQDARRRAEGDS